MSTLKTIDISNAVRLNILEDKRFKTVRISVNMLVPLTEKTAAVYGILPRIVTRASELYPDYTALRKKLADLYGAALDCSVSKIGGFQVISLFADGIASKLAFDGENMVDELSNLLLNVISKPLKDENGDFPLDGFNQEKAQVIDQFDSDFNNKILYSRKQAEQIMFEGMPEGISRNGTKEQVENLEVGELSSAWDTLLASSKFEIFVLGDCKVDVDKFKNMFSSWGQAHQYEPKFLKVDKTKEITEELDIAQSKLVMGFSADSKMNESPKFKLMCAVFGGTTSSKLFMNVREKMSLCYYCSAGFDTNTNAMFVMSGIETENIEKAKNAILEQLDEVKKGNITDDELEFAKLDICNGYRSVNDSLYGIEGWYLSQCLRDSAKSPEDAANDIVKITKEDVVSAANKVSLNTIYTLKGNA